MSASVMSNHHEDHKEHEEPTTPTLEQHEIAAPVPTSPSVSSTSDSESLSQAPSRTSMSTASASSSNSRLSQMPAKKREFIGKKPKVNGPLYTQAPDNVVLVRRRKRKDEGPIKQLARWFVENQIGMFGSMLPFFFLGRFIPGSSLLGIGTSASIRSYQEALFFFFTLCLDFSIPVGKQLRTRSRSS
jgi:hypothetical protein